MRLLLQILGNMAGIWLASMWVSTVDFVHQDTLTENLLALALIAVILTVVNNLIRPVMRVVAFPLYIITFGLFAIVTNALIFSLTGWLAGVFNLPLSVDSFGGALAGGTITAVVASIIVALLGPMANKTS